MRIVNSVFFGMGHTVWLSFCLGCHWRGCVTEELGQIWHITRHWHQIQTVLFHKVGIWSCFLVQLQDFSSFQKDWTQTISVGGQVTQPTCFWKTGGDPDHVRWSFWHACSALYPCCPPGLAYKCIVQGKFEDVFRPFLNNCFLLLICCVSRLSPGLSKYCSVCGSSKPLRHSKPFRKDCKDRPCQPLLA